MNKYVEILQLFVAQEELRPALSVPNIGRHCASATDGKALAFFDKNLLPENTHFKVIGDYPDIQRFIEAEPNCHKVLDFQKIKDVVSKCPLVADFDEEEKEDTCYECDGFGEVSSDYTDKRGDNYEIEIDCPVCDGVGRCQQTVRNL